MDATSYLPDAAHSMHHNHSFTLQKYLLLQEQHESLREHLDQIRPLDSAHSMSTSGFMSPAVSPTRSSSSFQSSPRSSRSPSMSRSRSHARRTSMPTTPSQSWSFSHSLSLEPVTDESTLHELATGEAKLFDVNEGIKRALTELLNCDAVRSDRCFRTWVQSRLMETEKELRMGRRRKSASPGGDY